MFLIIFFLKLKFNINLGHKKCDEGLSLKGKTDAKTKIASMEIFKIV